MQRQTQKYPFEQLGVDTLKWIGEITDQRRRAALDRSEAHENLEPLWTPAPV
jgi:hypothetical protein